MTTHNKDNSQQGKLTTKITRNKDTSQHGQIATLTIEVFKLEARFNLNVIWYLRNK